MMQTHHQFCSCGYLKLGVEQTKKWQISRDCSLSPKTFSFINTITFQVCGVHHIIYLFLQMTPLFPIQNVEKYITIYIIRLLSLETLEADNFLNRYYPCCGQENWFQNWSTEDFSVDKLWTPILSIAPTIINEFTNIFILDQCTQTYQPF